MLKFAIEKSVCKIWKFTTKKSAKNFEVCSQYLCCKFATKKSVANFHFCDQFFGRKIVNIWPNQAWYTFALDWLQNWSQIYLQPTYMWQTKSVANAFCDRICPILRLKNQLQQKNFLVVDGYEILVHYMIWNICALHDEIYVHYIIKYEIYGCYDKKWKNDTLGPT